MHRPRRLSKAVLTGGLAAILLLPAWLTPVSRDCPCGHGHGPAAHSADACRCPLHGRQAGGECHGEGAAPGEGAGRRCSIAPAQPVPAGFPVLFEALSRQAVLALAAQAVVPPPAAESVVEGDRTSTSLDRLAPPTPPPRPPFLVA